MNKEGIPTVDYVDPFKSLNDIKRQEREALLNSPASQQHKAPPVSSTFASLISRRDYFAAAALQGILSYTDELSIGAATLFAVKYADSILLRLDAQDGGEQNT